MSSIYDGIEGPDGAALEHRRAVALKALYISCMDAMKTPSALYLQRAEVRDVPIEIPLEVLRDMFEHFKKNHNLIAEAVPDEGGNEQKRTIRIRCPSASAAAQAPAAVTAPGPSPGPVRPPVVDPAALQQLVQDLVPSPPNPASSASAAAAAPVRDERELEEDADEQLSRASASRDSDELHVTPPLPSPRPAQRPASKNPPAPASSVGSIINSDFPTASRALFQRAMSSAVLDSQAIRKFMYSRSNARVDMRDFVQIHFKDESPESARRRSRAVGCTTLQYLSNFRKTIHLDFELWMHETHGYVVLAADWLPNARSPGKKRARAAPEGAYPSESAAKVRRVLGLRETRMLFGARVKGFKFAFKQTVITNTHLSMATLYPDASGSAVRFLPDAMYADMLDHKRDLPRPVDFIGMPVENVADPKDVSKAREESAASKDMALRRRMTRYEQLWAAEEGEGGGEELAKKDEAAAADEDESYTSTGEEEEEDEEEEEEEEEESDDEELARRQEQEDEELARKESESVLNGGSKKKRSFSESSAASAAAPPAPEFDPFAWLPKSTSEKREVAKKSCRPRKPKSLGNEFV